MIICQCIGKPLVTGATCQDIAGSPSAMLNVKVWDDIARNSGSTAAAVPQILETCELNGLVETGTADFANMRVACMGSMLIKPHNMKTATQAVASYCWAQQEESFESVLQGRAGLTLLESIFGNDIGTAIVVEQGLLADDKTEIPKEELLAMLTLNTYLHEVAAATSMVVGEMHDPSKNIEVTVGKGLEEALNFAHDYALMQLLQAKR